MTENSGQQNRSFRGPLKYLVETSAPQLEAGRNTSVYLNITNPYDVPVKILGFDTKVPVQFKSVGQGQASFLETLGDAVRIELAERESKTISNNVSAAGDDDTESPSHSSVGNNAEELAQDSNGHCMAPISLQPGNTTVQEFRVKTRQSLFFTPSIHNLSAEIRYEMDGTVNYDTIKYQLNIRAPLKALIYGAIAGSVVGTLLRYKGGLATSLDEVFTFLSALLSGILIAGVMVIAFARKKDAQPFITIEDFWGGFFVGFLAGYVGESLLEKLLPV